jgi:hypothetical protein
MGSYKSETRGGGDFLAISMHQGDRFDCPPRALVMLTAAFLILFSHPGWSGMRAGAGIVHCIGDGNAPENYKRRR